MAPTCRPSSHRNNQANGGGSIDKLDYHPGGRPLLHDEPHAERSGSPSPERSYAGSFFEDVAEGIVSQDRQRMKKEVARYIAFAWAIINCLGAGSITSFSLYAPLFQHNLRYTQLQVNGVSITAELGMYLPVTLWGFLCDRYGPGIPSLLAGVFFGFGYLIAAFAYKSGPAEAAGGEGWPYWVMIVAFVPIGFGTSCMYLSAVTTCAKNFGRGKYRGLALALPIACFGLSGMWQSQIGIHLLYETRPDGSRGGLDVHRYFLFLGTFLLATGVVGFFLLRVVGEEDLIDEAIEELEQSGLLEDSEFYSRSERVTEGHRDYGTLSNGNHAVTADSTSEFRRKNAAEQARLLEEKRKKTWLLNAETRHFLMDRTMWLLAGGFFLVTGPGEAFINNLGTVIGTLYTPQELPESGNPTSAATHVSIVAITSTLARILTGTLTDILAPTSLPHQHRRGPGSMSNSMASLPSSGRFELSRVTFLVGFCILMSVGQVILASGFIQQHSDRFWLVSAFIGAGYGAAFSLTPIILSVIWGVENFGTNWGICATVPAIGATVWGLVYSAVYQWAAGRDDVSSGNTVEDRLCFGTLCYAPTFWAMAGCVWIACVLWVLAWKGPGGWTSRGIAV